MREQSLDTPDGNWASCPRRGTGVLYWKYVQCSISVVNRCCTFQQHFHDIIYTSIVFEALFFPSFFQADSSRLPIHTLIALNFHLSFSPPRSYMLILLALFILCLSQLARLNRITKMYQTREFIGTDREKCVCAESITPLPFMVNRVSRVVHLISAIENSVHGSADDFFLLSTCYCVLASYTENNLFCNCSTHVRQHGLDVIFFTDRGRRRWGDIQSTTKRNSHIYSQIYIMCSIYWTLLFPILLFLAAAAAEFHLRWTNTAQSDVVIKVWELNGSNDHENVIFRREA